MKIFHDADDFYDHNPDIAMPDPEPDGPTCELCDDADATHVVLADTGDDSDGQAGATYKMACATCKDTRCQYAEEPLTDAWLRWFDHPWTTPPCERFAR